MNLSYRTNDKALLRFVLYTLWNRQCYWCGSPKEFLDTETDHIIPKSLSEEERKRVLSTLGKQESFDLDDLENLAPICGSCNGPGGKGSTARVAPIVLTKLDRAKKLKPRAIAKVKAFNNQADLTKNLLAILTADVGDATVRQLLRDYVPGVVQQLAAVEPVELIYRSTERFEFVNPGSGEVLSIDVMLDSQSLRTLVLFEDLFHGDLQPTLEGPVVEASRQLHRLAVSSFEDLDHVDGPINATAESDLERYTLTSIKADHASESSYFYFEGEYEAYYVGSLTRSDPSGDGLFDFGGDVVVRGAFQFTIEAALESPVADWWDGDVHVAEAHSAISIDGRDWD